MQPSVTTDPGDATPFSGSVWHTDIRIDKIPRHMKIIINFNLQILLLLCSLLNTPLTVFPEEGCRTSSSHSTVWYKSHNLIVIVQEIDAMIRSLLLVIKSLLPVFSLTAHLFIVWLNLFRLFYFVCMGVLPV